MCISFLKFLWLLLIWKVGTKTLIYTVAVAFNYNCVHMRRIELLRVASKAVYKLQRADLQYVKSVEGRG